MKVLFLALGLLALSGVTDRALAGPPNRTDWTEDGRLRIRYSPTLGMNIGLVILIDGRSAGAITRGHVFEADLSPGWHRLVVLPNGRWGKAFRTTLNVRPGGTYSYLAKFPPEDLVLEPTDPSAFAFRP